MKKNEAEWFVLMEKISKAWEKEEKEKEECKGEEEMEKVATVRHETMFQYGSF